MEEAVKKVHDEVGRIYSLKDCRLALEECGSSASAVRNLITSEKKEKGYS